MKRILVTGGAGFLGSLLCEKLLESGNEVICVDNFFTSVKANVIHLLSNIRFELRNCDVTIPQMFEVDQIYNLACPAAPGHYQYNPVKTIKTSIFGAINVLDLARETGATVLQASTSEVYGDPHVHPQPESYWGNVNPIGKRACYDEGKRAAETLFFDYSRQYNVDIRVARIFNTYGPRMHPFDGRVVSNFIRQAILGEPITIYGDGSQTRSFCYRNDLVDGLILLMNQPQPGPVNLGNPVEYTIRELAEKIVDLTGSASKIQYLSLPQDDPVKRKPVIDLARDRLGWEPKTDLVHGLKKTIEWFKSIQIESYRPPTPCY